MHGYGYGRRRGRRWDTWTEYTTSHDELQDFATAAIALVATFLLASFPDVVRYPMIGVFVIIGVLTGFVLHELAHRLVARSLGYIAFFKAWKLGLILSVLSGAFIGLVHVFHIPFPPFLIAAPGAVYIIPSPFRMFYDIRRDELMIAAAGPLTNILVAAVSLAFAPYMPYLLIVAYINAILAVFNLLPLPMLDGLKVLRANMLVWVCLFVVAVALFLGVHLAI